MKQSLRVRIAVTLGAVVSLILILSSVTLVAGIHYHFNMYQLESGGAAGGAAGWSSHLERAVMQAIGWTLLGSILIVVPVSIWLGKKLAGPLVRMKYSAEMMARGQLGTRTEVQGEDELAALGLALNRLADQLQEQERLRIAMTENIAHELRTPLTTLKSHLSALRDGIWQPSPERYRVCLDEIGRLIGLVSDLEDLNALESGDFGLSYTTVRVGELLERCAELLSPAYAEKGVGLRTEPVDDGLVMRADPDRMRQVLVNLLSNALKATPAGGKVVMSARPDNGQIRFSVKDTGAGITKEILPFIFERFYRGDKSRNRKTGGRGIGLAIVKALVQAHQGEVWAVSGDGPEAGSEFVAVIPQ
ncbi:MAG: integral rane sensor signal transduction histidine kinase [Paenibacillus sp.]|uniref:sensor histidine kinase n=1 Tax=Paenibacillus sp. GCM10012303 TaxID=3317340 RepID=UPI0029EF7EC0|nr:integral rane sensor signal transduction histidine kinase [Paenibacillus sp.]